MNHKGFTLIELVVVIGIIAVLAGLILVRISNVSLDARNVTRKNDLGAAKQAIDMYQVNGGLLRLDLYEGGVHQISRDNVCTTDIDGNQVLELIGPDPDKTGKRILDYLQENECPKDPKGYAYWIRVINDSPQEYCLTTYMFGPGENPELDYEVCY